jgi:hypothetical protein
MAELETYVNQQFQDDIADSEGEDEDLTLTGFPKTPRFGATLSVAAKFAQLQCYEDKIVNKLVSQFPDIATKLNRTKTPNTLDSSSSDGSCEQVLSMSGHKENCDVVLRKVTQSMNSAMSILDGIPQDSKEAISFDRTTKSYNDWSKSWVADFDL